ncbi:hypothetical protein QYF36_005215 [Acer negundo]|nr:hypothetical protein QYF36_005215 [Acer negundo]
MSLKTVNREGFRAVMRKIWQTREEVEIDPVKENILAFQFHKSDDKRKIISGGSWSFNDALIVMEEPGIKRDIQRMNFNKGRKWDYKEGYGFGRTYYRKEGIGRQSTRDTEERDGGRKPDVRLVDLGNTGKDILLASSSKGKEIVTTIEKGMNPDFMGFKDDLTGPKVRDERVDMVLLDQTSGLIDLKGTYVGLKLLDIQVEAPSSVVQTISAPTISIGNLG